MIVRAAEEADVERLVAFTPDPGLRTVEPDRLRADLAEDRIRPAWSWLAEELERLQHAWSPDAEVRTASDRVRFRPGDDEELLDLFAQTAGGSLDVETLRGVEEVGAPAQARDDLDFYLGCPGERAWWRVAVDDGGTAVGLTIPSATPHHRNVGCLGVLPPWRGRGLVDDLLSEITRVHAASGAERITATTDTTNAPVAATLDRAGYQVTEVRLVLSAP